MKFYIFFFVAACAQSLVATDDQTTSEETTLSGIIDRNENGELKGTVTYNKRTKDYWGIRENYEYSRLDWKRQKLRPFDAKLLYKKFSREKAAAKAAAEAQQKKKIK